ncbi:MAG: L-lactate dehydrogenase, partial [Ekhidna sp.]|nr:L-lactate dehydrogenase [Ekhidna sp.]
KSVHAHVIGEHGDSEVVLWSSAKIGTLPIKEWKNWEGSFYSEVAEKVKKAAHEIIRRKGATNHAIGLVTATLLKWLLRGDRRITTVSSVLNGAYGLRDVALSVPTLIGAKGIEEIIPIRISEEEQALLNHSAQILKNAIRSVKT